MKVKDNQADTLSVRNLTRSAPPRLHINSIKNSILGERYNLSIVYIGEKRALSLNTTHRKKDYPADILSFPLSKDSGEIFLCIPCARLSARAGNTPLGNFIAYLLIHGMLHLKGLRHGSTMDRAEKKLCKKLNIRYPYSE
jgi:rRNA maturation RNase YbeY